MNIRKRLRTHPEMHTGALNDILFILLLFFLIVSTLANPNVIKVSNPKAKSDTRAKQTVVVTVDKDQQIYLGSRKISFDQLEPELKNFLAKETDKPSVVINGDSILGKSRQKIAEILEELMKAEGSQRVMLLIEALSVIGSCQNYAFISSIGFKHDFVESENDRINAIYDYSIRNFKNKIQLEEIAAMANISPNSFCRYFKSRTRKTFSQFLIELRVGHACKLLIENNFSIKQICYESGFNNFTSFHKYFKMITGKSPLTYQKEFIAN